MSDYTALVSKDIFGAMLEVYKQTGYVQKKGKNTAQNYQYAGEAQFIEAIRPLLIEQQIIFYPHHVSVQQSTSEMDGKRQNKTVGQYEFRFHHVPSNTFMDVGAIGEGVDTGDKGAYKAATGALKYALRQALLIETGNDPEKDDKPEQANSPVFSSNAKRNTWSANLEKRMRESIDLDELKGIWAEEQAILNELKTSKYDYDTLAFDHLEKTKESCKEHHKKAAQ